MIAASAGSTGLYFYNYIYGFILVLALSLAHILLEFPLNALSVRQLGAIAAGGVRKAFAGGCAGPAAASSPAPLKPSHGVLANSRALALWGR